MVGQLVGQPRKFILPCPTMSYHVLPKVGHGRIACRILPTIIWLVIPRVLILGRISRIKSI